MWSLHASGIKRALDARTARLETEDAAKTCKARASFEPATNATHNGGATLICGRRLRVTTASLEPTRLRLHHVGEGIATCCPLACRAAAVLVADSGCLVEKISAHVVHVCLDAVG